MDCEQCWKLFTCTHKSLVFSSPLHMNMSVKVTGLESTKKRKAVYKTGTGTWGRGHWNACVVTWDLSPKSPHNCNWAGRAQASSPGRSGGREEKAARTHRRACSPANARQMPGGWADFVILV